MALGVFSKNNCAKHVEGARLGSPVFFINVVLAKASYIPIESSRAIFLVEDWGRCWDKWIGLVHSSVHTRTKQDASRDLTNFKVLSSNCMNENTSIMLAVALFFRRFILLENPSLRERERGHGGPQCACGKDRLEVHLLRKRPGLALPATSAAVDKRC